MASNNQLLSLKLPVESKQKDEKFSRWVKIFLADDTNYAILLPVSDVNYL